MRSPEAIGRWLDANLGTFDGPEQYPGNEPNTLLAEYDGDRARLWADRSACRWLLAASWPYDQAAGNMALPAIYNAIREAGPYLPDRWYQPLTPRDWETLVRAQIPVFGIETRHELRDFDVPLAPSGSPFQLAVWSALTRIPFGTTTSYGAIARQLGKPLAMSRAVGAANGQNPIAVVIPCHRVIGADGGLTGYGGGLERKELLLRLEGAGPSTLW